MEASQVYAEWAREFASIRESRVLSLRCLTSLRQREKVSTTMALPLKLNKILQWISQFHFLHHLTTTHHRWLLLAKYQEYDNHNLSLTRSDRKILKNYWKETFSEKGEHVSMADDFWGRGESLSGWLIGRNTNLTIESIEEMYWIDVLKIPIVMSLTKTVKAKEPRSIAK